MRRWVEIAVAASLIAVLAGGAVWAVRTQMAFEAYVERLTLQVTADCQARGGVLVKTATAYKCVKADVLY